MQRDDSNERAQEYLNAISRLIASETETYNTHYKPSPLQRMKDLTDIMKKPAPYLNTEYSPYKKILAKKNMQPVDKLNALIALAEKIKNEIDDPKQSTILGKWRYSGMMHSAIAEIDIQVKCENDENFQYVEKEIKNAEENALKSKSQTHDKAERKGSAPGRVERVNQNPVKPPPRQTSSAPARFSNSHATTFGASARRSNSQPNKSRGASAPQKQSKADECVEILKMIVPLIHKYEGNEPLKNEYIKAKYSNILINPKLSSEEKIEQLHSAAGKAKHEGFLHGIMKNADPNNDQYMNDLRMLRKELKEHDAVESAKQNVQDTIRYRK